MFVVLHRCSPKEVNSQVCSRVKNVLLYSGLYAWVFSQHTCLYIICLLLPEDTRRGRQIPWNWSCMDVHFHVGAGNLAQILQ